MVDIIFSIGCVVDKIHNHLLDMNLYKLCDERSAQGLLSLVVWKQLNSGWPAGATHCLCECVSGDKAYLSSNRSEVC